MRSWTKSSMNMPRWRIDKIFFTIPTRQKDHSSRKNLINRSISLTYPISPFVKRLS